MGVKHADARLIEDIHTLVESLMENRVYETVPGRVLDSGDPPVPDVVSVGLNQLSGPLQEYNAAFKDLQRRRAMLPVLSMDSAPPSEPIIPPPQSAPHSPPPLPQSITPQPFEEHESDGESEEDNEEGDEFTRILEEDMSTRGNDMLPQLTEADVAYDLGIPVWDEEDFEQAELEPGSDDEHWEYVD